MPCDCDPPLVTSANATAAGWCGLPDVAAAGGATGGRTAGGATVARTAGGTAVDVRTAAGGGAAAASAADVPAVAPPARPNPARARAAMVVRMDMDVSLSRRGCGVRRAISPQLLFLLVLRPVG